jgi:cell division inhibitor SulA
MVTLAGSRHSSRVVYGEDHGMKQLALLLPFIQKLVKLQR